MLQESAVLVGVGTVAVLLPYVPAYRSRLSRLLAGRAGAHVPEQQVTALEARAARRARAVGAGIVLAGLVLAGVSLLWPTEADASPLVALSLMFVLGSAALALMEIVRPGDVAAGPRRARTTTPVLADYVPPRARALSWAFTGLGLLVLLVTLLVGGSRWFDTETIWRSPVPFLLVAVPVVALLSQLAARRVLDAPQPARDESELYWQDAVRANTLTSLTVPPALVSLLGIAVSGSVLDASASTAAEASGAIGPGWSLALLVLGYLLPVVLVLATLVALSQSSRTGDPLHFRHRLWPGRTVDAPTAAGAA